MAKKKYQPRGTTIIYEDNDMIIVDKNEGLLSVATDHENRVTAHHILTDYIRKGQARSHKRLFIVHRLDRDTSGILMFAKSERVMNLLKDNWSKNKKTYLAVVHGVPEKKEDTISSHLAEDSGYVVFSTVDKEKGRLSHTQYKVIKVYRDRSLLEVNLLTGRKNQIRVHMADIGHPIIGDEKYGSKDNSARRMALHAWKMTLIHPITHKIIELETPVPECFYTLMGGKI